MGCFRRTWAFSSLLTQSYMTSLFLFLLLSIVIFFHITLCVRFQICLPSYRESCVMTTFRYPRTRSAGNVKSRKARH